MGYTTEFHGRIKGSPPLNAKETTFLNKFASTRRMDRENGPYFVNGSGFKGQDGDDDVIDENRPPRDQPGLWCQWVASHTGKSIEWDGNEKFYDSVEWMRYIIDHFLRPDCLAKKELPFLQANHICNGEIEAQGEDLNDRWMLIVKDNVVSTMAGKVVYG